MITASRLTLARKRRGLTLVRLSQLVGVSTRTLSGYENNDGQPSPETLARLAKVLDFPESFFLAEELDELNPDAASFRALSKLTAGQRDTALSAGRMAMELSSWIEDRFRLPEPDIPSLNLFHNVRDAANPEGAAEVVRARWGLGNAPVPNMIHLLEAHGVHVFSLAQQCIEVDAFSLWWKGETFIFLNTMKTAERSRFDAAHELGHLVLHGEDRIPHGREQEQEANHFAASFLMPKSSVLAHMPRNPSTRQIIAGKRIWKVAAMALTHRLYEIGLSSDWHYRNASIELGRLGYRSGEPQGIQRESSQVFTKVFSALRAEGLTLAEVAKELHLSPVDLSEAVFGLVVTALEGGKSGGQTQRPSLKVV
jgi:Zn-dependent peptidase ImmA (M78 family)/transcriptional regulator with XRE-family HTH domain